MSSGRLPQRIGESRAGERRRVVLAAQVRRDEMTQPGAGDAAEQLDRDAIAEMPEASADA